MYEVKAAKEHVAREGSKYHGPCLLELGESFSLFLNLVMGLGLKARVRCIKQSARNNQPSLVMGSCCLDSLLDIPISLVPY